ncbi:MAG: HD domain-containing protein [Clostridia bacterium]|nr:HD domain-containing protein [Clostridia bacterium]
MNIPMPRAVMAALNRLNDCGYEAHVVGGCVRDALRGVPPSDYDKTTSALPAETEAVFENYKLIETGLKHGTVTVLIDGEPLEITTFRVDGEYEDHRRPKEVTFTRSLAEDLARRDFTVNAMAYSPREGLTDVFGGRDDLKKGIIRAVGDPDKRFNEDALRILRAMRFASTLDFSIDTATSDSMIKNRALLADVSAERIQVELTKLIIGKGCERILTDYAVILGQIIPELTPMIGFDQRNPHHIHDVYTHTVKAVCACPCDQNLRLAALLHDIGKPSTYSVGADGVGHFYGHSEKSVELAAVVLERLRTDVRSQKEILTLIKYHDPVIQCTEASVGRWARKLGVDMLMKLLELKAADNLAQAPEVAYRLKEYDRIREIMAEMLQKNACFSLRDLAINGDDLIALGYKAGKALGNTLSCLLDAVICGELPNQRDALSEQAVKLLGKAQD